MTQVTKLLLALTALAFVASACSSPETSQANYVELDGAKGSVTTVFNPSGSSVEGSTVADANATQADATLVAQPADSSVSIERADSSDLDGWAGTSDLGGWDGPQILAAVEEFTTLRDKVESGSAHPADLEGIASPAIVAAVADARAINLDRIENGSAQARQDFVSFPSVIDATRQGDRIAAVSCTERWGLRTSDRWQTVFIDEAFVFTIVNDELRLSEHHVAHDGERATEGLTCLGGIFGERAIDGARRGVEVLDQIDADPAAASRIDVTEAFSGVALESMLAAPDAVDLGRRRLTSVETRYTPVGLDTSRGWDYIAVVSVCRHYPEGIFDVNEDGQRIAVDENHGPGTSIETLVFVHVEPERRAEGGGETFWDFQPDVRQGCW